MKSNALGIRRHHPASRLSPAPATMVFLVLTFFSAQLPAGGDKAGREEGEFRIYVKGKEIGSEKYSIVAVGDSSSSASVLQFRNPADGHEKIQLETKLEMDGHYVPRRYELKSDVNGEKGSILGTFTSRQVIFEYVSSTGSRKSGLLLGEKFTVLDTNIFHHFIFIARLFNFEDKGNVQKFEVAIPQEPDSGILNITDLQQERINVKGKKVEAHHLQADSGSVLMDLWVDNRRIVYKIQVKAKDIEVIRD